MATIAARKPYKVTQTATTINWTIQNFYVKDGPSLVQNTYYIKMQSFDPTVPEVLGVNISPFAEDLFKHIPANFPTTIIGPVEGEEVGILLDNGTFPALYYAYDGWDFYGDGTLALANQGYTKPITRNSKQYITAKLGGISLIRWVTSTGNFREVTNPNIGITESSIFPILIPGLTVSDYDTSITISGVNSTSQVVWRVKYELVCPYDDVYTIGFINRYGVWEYFDAYGRVIPAIAVEREHYIKYSDGSKTDYNLNGSRRYLLNTGWVSNGFAELIQDLLLSNTIILYKGSETDYLKLTLEDTDKVIKNNRGDGMMNYQFTFVEANNIIPVV